jgi:hypothetical protein
MFGGNIGAAARWMMIASVKKSGQSISTREENCQKDKIDAREGFHNQVCAFNGYTE